MTGFGCVGWEFDVRNLGKHNNFGWRKVVSLSLVQL